VESPEALGTKVALIEGRSGLKGFVRNYFRDREGVLGLALFLLPVLVAVFGRYLILYEPNETIGSVLESPSVLHFMGTDPIGRDVFSHVVLGSRVSLLFGSGGEHRAGGWCRHRSPLGFLRGMGRRPPQPDHRRFHYDPAPVPDHSGGSALRQ